MCNIYVDIMISIDEDYHEEDLDLGHPCGVCTFWTSTKQLVLNC